MIIDNTPECVLPRHAWNQGPHKVLPSQQTWSSMLRKSLEAIDLAYFQDGETGIRGVI